MEKTPADKETGSPLPPDPVTMVVKRDGSKQAYDKVKVKARLDRVNYGLNTEFIKIEPILKKIEQGIHADIKTRQIDDLIAETWAYSALNHPDYSMLASRVAVSKLHKETESDFATAIKTLRFYIDTAGRDAPLVSEEVYNIVMEHKEAIQEALAYTRDMNYDYFGYKTLEKSYLLKCHGKISERPQGMLMRVALGIHGDDIKSAVRTYNLMSDKWFTHATPTLFNSGTPKP